MTITNTGTGTSFLYGTAMEHSELYQYNFSSASGITTITTQTESDYWSTPPSGWAMVHENAEVQMYGSGWYNWFNGNQTALWTSSTSKGNAFCINVHGTSNVIVGDVTVPAYTPVEEDWRVNEPQTLPPRLFNFPNLLPNRDRQVLRWLHVVELVSATGERVTSLQESTEFQMAVLEIK